MVMCSFSMRENLNRQSSFWPDGSTVTKPHFEQNFEYLGVVLMIPRVFCTPREFIESHASEAPSSISKIIREVKVTWYSSSIRDEWQL
jgi:hypothetical protein